jgi:hypothetical protein
VGRHAIVGTGEALGWAHGEGTCAATRAHARRSRSPPNVPCRSVAQSPSFLIKAKGSQLALSTLKQLHRAASAAQHMNNLRNEMQEGGKAGEDMSMSELLMAKHLRKQVLVGIVIKIGVQFSGIDVRCHVTPTSQAPVTRRAPSTHVSPSTTQHAPPPTYVHVPPTIDPPLLLLLIAPPCARPSPTLHDHAVVAVVAHRIVVCAPLAHVPQAIFYYSTLMFRHANVADPQMATTLLSLVNLTMTFIAMAIMEKAGRRALIMVTWCATQGGARPHTTACRPGSRQISREIARDRVPALPWRSPRFRSCLLSCCSASFARPCPTWSPLPAQPSAVLLTASVGRTPWVRPTL